MVTLKLARQLRMLCLEKAKHTQTAAGGCVRPKPKQQTNTTLISRRYHCVFVCVPQAHRRYRILVRMALCESGNEGTMKLLAPGTPGPQHSQPQHTQHTQYRRFAILHADPDYYFYHSCTYLPASVRSTPPRGHAAACSQRHVSLRTRHTTHTRSGTPCCCLQLQCLRADLAHAGMHHDALLRRTPHGYIYRNIGEPRN